MIWSLVYSVVTLIVLPFALLYHWYRSVSRGRKSAFGERFGFLAPAARQLLAGQQVLWLHAVSVGEVIAARPLIKGVRRAYPDHRLLLSVTTETGRIIAEQDQLADVVTYFPFDVRFAVCRLLDAVQPQAVIIMETEIWPVFTLEAAQRKIPLVLANGRISERSFPRYLRFAWFFTPVLQRFSRIGMQSEADLQRIIAIGAPVDRSRVLGNLKYDIPFSAVGAAEKRQLRDIYQIPLDLPVLIAGSTHPGEEQQVLAAYCALKHRFPQLMLVLVPRHPERADEVALLISQSGCTVVRRSDLGQQVVLSTPDMVLLVDTVGELMPLYALSDIAFVGGSLVPTGGHNLLEPASRGIPLLFGPHMNNFREITSLVLDYGAGIQVADVHELQEAVRDFLLSPELRQVIGTNGLKLLRDSGGSVARHIDLLAEALSV